MPARHLRDLLDNKVKENHSKTFIFFEDKEINYRDFDIMVSRIANGLLNLGIRKGETVSLLLPNSAEFLYFFHAIAKIGAVSGPINTGFKGREIKYNLNHSEATALVATSSLLESVEGIKEKCGYLRHLICVDRESMPGTISLSRLIRDASSLFPAVVGLTGDDTACIMFTSGTSTAKPKGVLITNSNFINASRFINYIAGMSSEDRIFFVTPLFHSNALAGYIAALTSGASVAFVERFSSSRFWLQISQYQPSIFVTLGPILAMLLNLPRTPAETKSSLRVVIAPGIGKMSEKVRERYQVQTIDVYGMTESLTIIGSPVEETPPIGSCGRNIMPGLEVKILDEQGREAPPGIPGEIIIKNQNIMKGYFKNPEAMEEAIKNNWFHTGDMAYKDNDGYLYFIDRKKDIVRRSGENISAREVEEVLNTHPKILESAVIGIPDRIRGEEIKAYLMVKPGEEPPSLQDIVAYCKERLADFKVPRYIKYQESFPKTSTGRIQKVLLNP